MDLTILVREEPTLGISQSKVPIILRILELNPSREIGRPCGVGKDHIEFKLLCGWRVNGVLELLPYALDVTKMMKPLFMC